MPTQTNPLDALHPAIEPSPIGYFPLAYGWWLLIAIIGFILLLTFIFIYIKSHQRVTKISYRRYAKKSLKELTKTKDNKILAIGINNLLKRTAITAYENNKIAALSGEKWLKFLDMSIDSKLFDSNVGESLLLYAYGEDNIKIDATTNKSYKVAFHRKELLRIVALWIDKHQAIIAD